MAKYPLYSLFFGFLLFSAPAFAQFDDVCCILGKKAGSGAETRAEVNSRSECMKGNNIDGYTVCSAKPDPQNLCSLTTPQTRCGSCNYYWTGQDCLVEDPVEKAKEEVRQEIRLEMEQKPVEKTVTK